MSCVFLSRSRDHDQFALSGTNLNYITHYTDSSRHNTPDRNHTYLVHIISTEYEDTRQVHETLHKEIKPEEHGPQVVEDRETELVEKKEDEIEEEIIVIERDKKGRLIQKKPKKQVREVDDKQVVVVEEEEIITTKRAIKPKMEEKIEIEEIVEEEEEEETRKKKMLKTKRPKKGEEDIDFEEVEVFELSQDKAIPSLPVNISSQRHEIVPLTRTIEQAPGKPETETAKLTLDTVNALTEEYIPIQESEDTMSRIKPDQKNALVTIAPVEPYSTTETTVHGSHGEFKGTFKPTTFEATAGVVTKPKESLQITETLPNDAKLTGLDLKHTSSSQKAEVSLTLQEATTVSETTINQSEVPTQDFITPASATAEDTMLPNIGLSIYEVQEGFSEDTFEHTKPVSARPRVNVNAVEPLTIEEVQTEDKPGKYYPELIVPTEMATTTVVSQKLLITEEMHAPEKEGDYIPGRLPPGQNAQIGVSEGGEAPSIQEQPVQEMEGIFIPGRKIDTFEAERNINLLESLTVCTVETQHQETHLVVEETKKATADLNVVEKSSVFTTETVTSEREIDYESEEKPIEKIADSSILPLEIGSISSTIVQESEGIYNEQVKPTSAIAETSLRPEEYVMVSQVQTADVPADFNEDLKYVTESGTVSVQLTEAKMIQETFTHDHEDKFEELTRPEEKIVDMTYDSVKGIEVYQTTSIDKEGNLQIYEMPESHRGKVVPTHSVVSFQVEETRPEDNLGAMEDLIPITGKAKIEHDNLRETVVDITVTDERLGAVEKDKVPESKYAEVGLNEIESVKTTEVIVNETEETYKGIAKAETVFATTGFATQSAIEQQEVRTESPTGEMPDEVRATGTAQSITVPLESVTIALQQLAEKEDIYTEDIKPESKIASIDLTETRPGAIVLEVVTHDAETTYHPGDKPQDFTALSTIDSHTIAVKSEVLIEQSAGKISDDKTKTVKAFGTQEALDELIVVETNVAETENPRLDEAKPVEQKAQLEMTTSENLTVMEVTTVQKEETLQTEELAAEKTITMNLTSSHEVAQTEETVVANNYDALSEVKPKSESATLQQSGLEIVQQTELSISEKESDLLQDLKPETKTVDVSFTEGEGVEVLLIHPEDKEGRLEDRVRPKTFEASMDFEVQGVASKYEILSDTDVGEFSTETPKDAKPETTLILFETACAEEIQTRETEAPFADIQPGNRTAELAFEIGEGIIVSSIETGDKEKPLQEMEKLESKSATFEFTSHPVAQATETIPEYGAGEFKPEATQPATAVMDHVAHKSVITLETSVEDREGLIDQFVRPDSKTVDVAFQEAQISLNIMETITSDKEKEYIREEDIAKEKATSSFNAHKVAESTEVTISSTTDELKEQVPKSAVATEDHLPFEGVIRTEAVVSEKETEFTEKPLIATNKAEITIGDEGNVTSVSEVMVVDKEGSLKIPEQPEERKASMDMTGHQIAEKTEITVDSSAGLLEEVKPVTAAAVSSQIPLETVIRSETQPTEAEGILAKDQKPTEALADLSVVEDLGLEVTMVTMEDKESEYTAKELPESRTADKAFVGGHLVAETTEHVTDFSTKDLAEDKPEVSTAVLDQITFNPLTSSLMIVGESEDRLIPDVKPEDHTAKVDVEFGRSTVTVSEVNTGEKETNYVSEILPTEKLASMEIDSTHEIAQTISTTTEDALGDVERIKMDTVKALSSQEVFRSLLISQEIVQDKEQSFEGTFKPEVKDVEVSIEDGKSVTTITEVTAEAKEGTLADLIKPESREAISALTSSHEVAEQSEVIPNFGTGDVEILKSITATARVGQRPYETVEHTEEFLGEREADRIEVKTVTTTAKIALDEQSSVIIATTMTQDLEEELSVPTKPREATAQPAVEGKEVAQQSEVTPKEGLGDLLVIKPTGAEAKETQGILESINVTQAIAEELGTDFTGKFKPDEKSAAVSFVEGKSVTVDEVIIQDKEGSVAIIKHVEGVAEVRLNKVGQDVAQKTEIIVDQSTGLIAPFESDKRTAHSKQDTLEPVIIEEVPVGESEGSFVDYPKSISSKVTPSFEEGHSVSITEVTSGESEKTFEVQKLLESRTAESTVITEHGSILTTVVDSRVDVKTETGKDDRTPQIAIPSQETFESLSVTENQVEESEQPFDGKFKPTTQTAVVDIQEVKSLQVSQTLTEDREETFEGTPKIHGVQAKSDISVLEIVQKSQVETIDSIGEVQDEKTVTSQAVITQTTMESIIKTETMTGEREDTFVGKFIPEEQKGVAHVDGLSTVAVTEIYSNEIEDTLAIDVKPKDRRALPNVTGREVAQTTEVETVADAEEFEKFKGPEGVQGKPQVDTLLSLIVSQTVSNEAEDFLPSPEVPSQKSVQFNLDTREIAQTSEVETILTVGDFVKAKGPEEQTGRPDIEEFAPLTVSQVVSNETQEDMPSAEKPSVKSAQSSLLGREIAETSEVETLLSAEHFIHAVAPEERQGTFGLEEMTSVIVSQTVSGEVEDLLPGQEQPSSKVAQSEIWGRDVAETSQVLTLASFDELTEIKPEKQHGQPGLEEHSSVNVSQVVSNEVEQDLPTPEKPTEKNAEPNLLGREIAQTSEVATLYNAEELTSKKVPKEEQGKPGLEEMTSLIVSQTMTEEVEVALPGQEQPSTKTAHPDIFGRDVAETSQVLTLASFDELSEEKPETQKGKPGFEEHSSMNVSQIVFNEMEEELPSAEQPSSKIAQPTLSSQEIAETSQIVTLSSTGEFIEDKIPEEKRGQASLEEMTSIIVSQTVSEETEEQLPGQEKPSIKTAQPDILGHDIAETSQVLTLASFEELTEKKPEEQRSKPGFEELTSVTVSQVISNETENEMPGMEQPSTKTAQPDILGHEIAEVSQVVTLSTTAEFIQDKAPEERKGKRSLEEMTSLIVSQTVYGETEDLLPGQEQPITKTAQPDVLGRDIAQTSQVMTLSSFEKLTEKKPEEQKGKPELEEHTAVTVSQVVSNEVEEDLPRPEVPKEKNAEANLLGREIAESSEVTTHLSTEDFSAPKAPEGVRGKPELDEMTSVIVRETISNEAEENLPSPQAPTEVTAKPNLFGRETAETIQVTTVSNAEELPASTLPEEQRGKPRLDELSSLIVSQALSNEAEITLPSPEMPLGKTAQPNLFGREIAETSQVLTMTNAEDLARVDAPEQAKGQPEFDTLSSAMVSQVLSNETEALLPREESPSEKIAQPHLSGRDVAMTSHIMILTSTEEFISSIKPEGQEGKPNIEELSSINVSQVISNELEETLPSAEKPSEGLAKPNLSGREAAETIQVVTVSNTEELTKQHAPEGQTIRPTLDELTSLTVSQVNANEAEDVLPSPEKPAGKTAQPNIFGREVAEKTEVITSRTTEKLIKQETPEGQQGKPELEGLSTVTISEILYNEMENTFPEEEKPRKQNAIKQMDSIEVAETTEIITATFTEKLPEQAAPEGQKGRPNLEELISLSISEITQGETEDVLPSPDVPSKQLADSSLSGRPVAQKTQVLTTTSTDELPSAPKPDKKKAQPEQIPYEIFEQSIQQTQDSESILTISKKAPTAQAEMTFNTSESIKVTQIVANEKESKEVIKGIANEVNAQPDVMESQVAVTLEILPKTTVSEFDVEKPLTKTARAVDDENRSVIVTELGSFGEHESDLPESITPFSKLAKISYETEHLEHIVGEYLPSCVRSM